MAKVERLVFSREYKLGLVRRLLAGEGVLAVATEQKIRRNLLYNWRDKYRSGGEAALRLSGGQPRVDRGIQCPSEASCPVSPEAALEQARQRIAALEQTVGRQQLDLDFFRAALRQVRERDQAIDAPGAAASTASSTR
jgi:transposase-like protein